VEICKGSDDFADELSKYCALNSSRHKRLMAAVSLDPPLPVYLFNVVALMRDKTAKGYPIKKVCTIVLVSDML